MISSVRPLYAGNALQITLVPPAGAKAWRLLRKGADDFSGQADPDALVVLDGTDRVVVDAEPGLINQTPAFYRAYYWSGSAWTASATAQGTPLAGYGDASADAPSLVRSRLEAGLAVEVARQVFTPSAGYIRVLSAPPVADQVELPVVTVHVEQQKPGARGVGEEAGTDAFDSVGGQWEEREGWLEDVQLELLAWCTNPDERSAMRQAMRRILVSNLAVFEAYGLAQIEFSLRDVDLLEGQFATPIYQVVCSFTCMAPVIVTNKANPIADVSMSASGEVAPSTL